MSLLIRIFHFDPTNPTIVVISFCKEYSYSIIIRAKFFLLVMKSGDGKLHFDITILEEKMLFDCMRY